MTDPDNAIAEAPEEPLNWLPELGIARSRSSIASIMCRYSTAFLYYYRLIEVYHDTIIPITLPLTKPFHALLLLCIVRKRLRDETRWRFERDHRHETCFQEWDTMLESA